MWGLVNYLPTREQSEDEETVVKHQKWLQIEATKKYPSIQRVQTAMDLTLAARRHWIVNEQPTIKDVRDQYPWLFKPEQVI